MATVGASMPFIKQLAASDSKSRTKSLDTLKSFLSTKYGNTSARMSYGEAHTLWVGLYYALWMTDRAPAQQRLCDELGALPAQVGLSDASVEVWYRAFWTVLSREWTKTIDVLRINKFMLLVRRVLCAQLVWMGGARGEKKEQEEEEERESNSKSKKNRKAKRSAKSEKSEKSVRRREDAAAAAATTGLALLEAWPLNPEAEATLEADEDVEEGRGADADEDERPAKRVKKTMRIPVGLTAHVLDIWVDEVERLGLLPGRDTEDAEEEEEAPKEKSGQDENSAVDKDSLVFRVNELVRTLAAKTTAPAVRKHAREALEDERLPWNRKGGEDGAEEKEEQDEDEGSAQGDGWDGFHD